MPTPVPTAFTVFGYGFTLGGNSRQAIEGLAEDFAFFAAGGAAMPMQLVLDEGRPDYGGLPPCDASVYTPRNVVYRDGRRRFIDFGGRGLAVFDEAANCFRMTAEDPDLVYEAAYLFLLSRIGAHADRRGLHRIHAMAVVRHGRAVLVMLPMGGGKSTLLAAMLKDPGVSVLSDDSPFVDRRATLHAFPLRLGILEAHGMGIPPDRLRKVNRMEFGPKYLLSYSQFADRVVARADAGLLIAGRRTLAAEGRIEPASYASMMRALTTHSIVGLGLFHGLEYMLQHSSIELLGQAGAAWSRARNAHALVRRSHNLVFHMGRDVDRNAALLVESADRLLGGG